MTHQSQITSDSDILTHLICKVRWQQIELCVKYMQVSSGFSLKLGNPENPINQNVF